MGKLKLADAEEFWQCADEDGNGILSIVELRHAVIKYAKSKGQPVPCQNAIKRMFQGCDHSDDGKVTKAEFIREMTEKEDRDNFFCKKFKELDKDGNGTLSRDEVRQMFQSAKNKYSAEEIEEIIDESDVNKDGIIQYSEFEGSC